MSFLNPFRKDKRPPRPSKAVEKIFEKMRVELEGRKLADEAISYRNLGEYEKALRLLMDAVQKYNYTPALTLIGTTILLKGDVDGAIDWFDANIKNPPKGSSYLAIEWYANLGVIYLYKKEDCKKACVMCEKTLSPSKPIEISDEQYNITISAVHRDLAVAYLACGEISLALDFAKKRLAFNPGCDTSKKVISMCSAQLNKTSHAPYLAKQPSCGTVIFSPDGKANLIATGGNFSSGTQRFAHAMGHILLHDLYESTDTSLPQYRDQIKKDVALIESWAKVIDSKWTNEQEERFARQHELFMSQKKPELDIQPIQGEILDPAIRDILDRQYSTL